MPLRTVRFASIVLRTALAAALLAACSSQSASTTPPTVGAPGTVLGDDGAYALSPLAPITTFPGAVVGEPNAFHPGIGDYPGGGSGQTVGGIPCRATMFINSYHVHVFLGIINRGKQVALPYAIGMFDPGPAQSGFVDTAGCYYFLHTHDSSGIVHIEAPQNQPLTDSIYTLSRLFKVWGLQLSPTGVGPLHGEVHAFVGNVPLKQTVVSAYREFKGDPNDIKLKSHEVIWLEIGKKYFPAAKLPPVTFYMEY
jgi:hypothetical protein